MNGNFLRYWNAASLVHQGSKLNPDRQGVTFSSLFLFKTRGKINFPNLKLNTYTAISINVVGSNFNPSRQDRYFDSLVRKRKQSSQD